MAGLVGGGRGFLGCLWLVCPALSGGAGSPGALCILLSQVRLNTLECPVAHPF